MIYLDNGATSFWKPPEVEAAMAWALRNCANPGRGGYGAALRAGKVVYRCRETAAELFGCRPEQVVFTSNCTHGLNIALNSLIKPGDRVVISGFEHNAVTRTLHRLKAVVMVAGRRLFDPADTLAEWENALKNGAKVGITTHVSNVFGYILPVAEMAALCRKYGVPFVLDAAQSAGSLPVRLDDLGAAFIAMPGHKGLLGPQGTGLLLCAGEPEPLITGGTGSESIRQEMPEFLPDRAEAGTLNVPGIAGLDAAMRYLRKVGIQEIARREHQAAAQCVQDLREAGIRVFSGEHQAGTVSFLPEGDCEETAKWMEQQAVAVRAGLHCAPLAHESAGTLETGTVRLSFGTDACPMQNTALRALWKRLKKRKRKQETRYPDK